MRRNHQFLLIILLLVVSPLAMAQNSLSFYHLGDATYQNSSFNPAWAPDARVFIGLPVMSGVHVHLNSKFSYNDVFVKEGNNNLVKISRVISDLQKQNMLNAQANISLLHLGYRLRNGMAVSVFANERFEADFLYSKTLMEFLWEENTTNLGETVELGSLGINATHFREIGFGVAYQLDKKMKVGARVKMLQGFFNYSTPRNVVADIKIDPQTYSWDLKSENLILQSSGQTTYGDNLVSPGNSGVAIDIGFEYDLSRYLSFSGSITDVGFISWKEDIKNKVFSDTSFLYAGVDTRANSNIITAVRDSLLSRFSTSESTTEYKTWLPTKAYGSMTYRYGDTYFIGTIGARYIQGQLKMLYGGGIRQKIGPLTASVNAMRLPQHVFDLGAALAVRGGPVQYYVAFDQLLSLSVPDTKAFDFRTGINIMIGHAAAQGPSSRGSTTSYSNDKRGKTSNKGISTGSFLGTKVKTKKREGIYSIISKQKKHKVPKSVTPLKGNRKRKVTPRSIPPPTQKKAPKKKRN